MGTPQTGIPGSWPRSSPRRHSERKLWGSWRGGGASPRQPRRYVASEKVLPGIAQENRDLAVAGRPSGLVIVGLTDGEDETCPPSRPCDGRLSSERPGSGPFRKPSELRNGPEPAFQGSRPMATATVRDAYYRSRLRMIRNVRPRKDALYVRAATTSTPTSRNARDTRPRSARSAFTSASTTG